MSKYKVIIPTYVWTTRFTRFVDKTASSNWFKPVFIYFETGQNNYSGLYRAQLLRELVHFVTAKDIQPYVHKTFGFERAEVLEAFDYLKSGQHIGKIGIAIDDKKYEA
ncbi:hypothetical protein DVH05_015494 [Phytophthora capsici]|nr:hypothetical protein DVH05_015494 [Phytophthora capsici]